MFLMNTTPRIAAVACGVLYLLETQNNSYIRMRQLPPLARPVNVIFAKRMDTPWSRYVYAL